MSFGNVPRDLNLCSLSSLRSIASKSTNGYFSADLRTVGSLVPQASWIFTQGPIGTWTQNGPALVGTGATLPATLQGYPRISGNGKVLAVLDYSDQGFLWIFV